MQLCTNNVIVFGFFLLWNQSTVHTMFENLSSTSSKGADKFWKKSFQAFLEKYRLVDSLHVSSVTSSSEDKTTTLKDRKQRFL